MKQIIKREAIKLCHDKYPENELEIMKKCDNLCVVKLLDSFTLETEMGSAYGIVMDFFEVKWH